MRTSIVYILVSTSDDFFYEQTLISAWSARYWNPDVKILCVMDELTDATLTDKRTALLEIIDEKIVVDLSEGGTAKYTGKERSRMLKTNLRSYVEGDLLYIDSDTVVCCSLDDVDSFQFALGAVDDAHGTYWGYKRWNDSLVRYRVGLLGKYDVSRAKNYFNSGVLYMKDTEEVRKFMKGWHSLYMTGQSKGLSFDQPSLLVTNTQLDLISPMDDIYNCQILSGGLPFFAEAKILHYYNSLGTQGFCSLTDARLYGKIKKSGFLDEDDKKKIRLAKRQFVDRYSFVYGKDLKFWNSSLRHLFHDSPKLFGICEIISKIFLKFLKFSKQ